VADKFNFSMTAEKLKQARHLKPARQNETTHHSLRGGALFETLKLAASSTAQNRATDIATRTVE
jgi:hypothetical protein